MHSISNSNTDKSHKLDDDRVELKKHNDDAITKISNMYLFIVFLTVFLHPDRFAIAQDEVKA
jgi:hypothetical protein